MTNEELERGSETEPRPEEVLGEILKRHEARRQKTMEQPRVWFEDRLKSLPEGAQQDLRKYDERLAAKGLNIEARTDLLEDRIVSFEQTYIDRRFTVGGDRYMLRESFGKEQATSWLKKLLDEKPTIEDLNKVALLSFDANGLKAVNDLSSHERGTEYLKRIAEVFFSAQDDKSPIGARLRELGVTEVIPLVGGGDEFSVAIRSDASITPEAVEESLKMFEQAIAALNVSDLIDFNSLDAQLRYLGLTRQAYDGMEEGERTAAINAFRKDIPEGFVMRASASGGAATMLEGLRHALKDSRSGKRIEMIDGYDQTIDKIVGGLWDTSDAAMVENKNWFKRRLRGETDTEMSFEETRDNRAYAKILIRTTEARVLEARLHNLTNESRAFRAFDAELAVLNDLLAKELIQPAEYARLVQEKQKGLSELLARVQQ